MLGACTRKVYHLQQAHAARDVAKAIARIGCVPRSPLQTLVLTNYMEVKGGSPGISLVDLQ